ncbi:hypothetical protein [Moorena sp. SIO1G6]|nr:hypothetical protein [Moorena sp. SIO1G6]
MSIDTIGLIILIKYIQVYYPCLDVVGDGLTPFMSAHPSLLPTP